MSNEKPNSRRSPGAGQVVEVKGKRGKSFALRFRAYGKRRYITLGTDGDGWSSDRAETELRHVLADVERGIWQPPQPAPEVEEPAPIPSFHEFASAWLEEREPELTPGTVEDYRWALSGYLLPYFSQMKITEITRHDVDLYKAKVLRDSNRRREAIEAKRPLRDREGHILRPLSPNSINKTLTRLSQVLGTAVEYELIESNPAAGRSRRLKRVKPNRPHIEPEQLMALLDAAGELEGGYEGVARPILATLAGAGLRIGEALALRWADVTLSSRTLRVGASKTEAGVREVALTPALESELAALWASQGGAKDGDPVFASAVGTQLDRHRVRERILKPSIKVANVVLAKEGIELIGEVGLHGLRRTYASLRFALRDDPVYIAEQLGHEEAAFSMKVYARAVKRRERLSGATLAAFDRALRWAEVGRNPGAGVSEGAAVGQ
jgi:integrase